MIADRLLVALLLTAAAASRSRVSLQMRSSGAAAEKEDAAAEDLSAPPHSAARTSAGGGLLPAARHHLPSLYRLQALIEMARYYYCCMMTTAFFRWLLRACLAVARVTGSAVAGDLLRINFQASLWCSFTSFAVTSLTFVIYPCREHCGGSSADGGLSFVYVLPYAVVWCVHGTVVCRNKKLRSTPPPAFFVCILCPCVIGNSKK